MWVTRTIKEGKSNLRKAHGCRQRAYAYHRPVKASTQGNDVYVCSYFWFESSTQSVYDKYKDLDKKYIVMKGLQGTYTRSVIHELFHTTLVTQDRPHPIDQLYQGARAYGAEVISEWVTQYKARPADVLANADSFAIFVSGSLFPSQETSCSIPTNAPIHLAIYWKNKFGFLPPPDQEDTFRDKRECYNMDGDQYFSRGTAITHIDNFCEEAATKYQIGVGGTFEKNYESGMPEMTTWSMKTNSKSAKPGAEVHDKCRQAMGELIDGCDTNNGFWKTGGVFTWESSSGGDEYEFAINPKRERPLPKGKVMGKCDVWYKFFYDEVRISLLPFSLSLSLTSSSSTSTVALGRATTLARRTCCLTSAVAALSRNGPSSTMTRRMMTTQNGRLTGACLLVPSNGTAFAGP